MHKNKNLFNTLTKHRSNPKRKLKTRLVLARLNRDNRLARNPKMIGKLLLRHLIRIKTAPTHAVLNRHLGRPSIFENLHAVISELRDNNTEQSKLSDEDTIPEERKYRS